MLTPTPQTIVTYTTPLDDVTVQTMTTELAALEQRPVNGWDVVYPTLYNTLRGIAQEFCTSLSCTVPHIFITFQGIQRHQASAHLMTDGTTQLHIGVDFIRATLLNTATPDREVSHRAFRWAIAHEIGHLNDPAFNRFGRSYQLRTILDGAAQGCAAIGLVGWAATALAFMNTPDHITIVPSNINYPAVLGVGIAFMVLKALVITVLHRKFEYTADAIAARLIDDGDHQAMTLALTTMITAIRSSITNPYAQATWPMLRLYGWLYQRGTTARLFFLHPSMERRVKRLQKA
jgi:hypothetical protein